MVRPLAVAAVLTLALTTPAGAQREPASLSEAAVIERDVAVEVWVRLSRPVKYQAELMDSPWRLVLDFEGTAYRWAARPVAVGIDVVREVRGSQYRQGVARLVIELRRKAAYTIEQDREGLRIVLPRDRADAGASAPPAPVVATAAPAKLPGATPATPAGPRVHGIIMLDERAHAYIFDPATKNVRRYAVGDRFADAVVETIAERHVVLRTPSGRVELRVEEPPPPASLRAPRPR